MAFPQPPTRVWVSSRTPKSITVKWRIGSGGTYGRYCYIIKLNGRHLVAFKKTNRIYTIRGLKPKRRYRISVQVKDKRGRYSTRREIRPKTPPPPPKYVHPLPGARKTSPFGPRWGTMHKGVDMIRAHNTPIKAVADGKVSKAGSWAGGYGISVLVRHSNGDYSHYAHLNSKTVSAGQTVKVGQVIGRQGNTGDSTGSHLHFEIHKGRVWNQINPQPWMRSRGIRL